MPSPTLLAVIICVAVAILEGALTGKGARQRFAELRMPSHSPPFTVWLLIGFAYYAICFVVLRHLLTVTPLTRSLRVALVLIIIVFLANALWNILFFRRRDLWTSFIAFIPYAALVAALAVSLSNSYPFGAVLFACYCAYLLYAAWWAYRLWQLNKKAVANFVGQSDNRRQ